MSNPYGSKTIGTYLPLPLHTRMLAYLKFNDGSVSSFIRQAIEVKLADFPDPQPHSEDIAAATSSAMALYRSIRARLADIGALNQMSSYVSLGAMRSELEFSRRTFEIASVDECGHKYATAYIELSKILDSKYAIAKEWYKEMGAAKNAAKQ